MRKQRLQTDRLTVECVKHSTHKKFLTDRKLFATSDVMKAKQKASTHKYVYLYDHNMQCFHFHKMPKKNKK